MRLCGAYPRETQEMVFDAHDRAIGFSKALPRGIYDNMKTAVETIFVGRDAPTTVASCKCAAIILLIRSLHAGIRLGEGAGREPGRGWSERSLPLGCG